MNESDQARGAKERRRHPRKDSAARLFIAGGEHDLVDLSRGGMCVSTATLLPAGGRVPFELRLPGEQGVEGVAEVRWADATGWKRAHGLEFVAMGLSQRRRLSEHLDPRRFGVLEALELAFAAGAVILAGHALRAAPSALQAAVDAAAPWAWMAGDLGLNAASLTTGIW